MLWNNLIITVYSWLKFIFVVFYSKMTTNVSYFKAFSLKQKALKNRIKKMFTEVKKPLPASLLQMYTCRLRWYH